MWRRLSFKTDADRVLSLAAAPTFAAMALLTVVSDSNTSGVLCATAHAASPWTGMAAMYLLMTAFHSAPWLRRVANRRLDPARRRP